MFRRLLRRQQSLAVLFHVNHRCSVTEISCEPTDRTIPAPGREVRLGRLGPWANQFGKFDLVSAGWPAATAIAAGSRLPSECLTRSAVRPGADELRQPGIPTPMEASARRPTQWIEVGHLARRVWPDGLLLADGRLAQDRIAGDGSPQDSAERGGGSERDRIGGPSKSPESTRRLPQVGVAGSAPQVRTVGPASEWLLGFGS